MTRYQPRIDTDEDGFRLVIPDPHTGEDRYTFPLDASCLDSFYDQVKARIGPYLRERDDAKAAWKAPVPARFLRGDLPGEEAEVRALMRDARSPVRWDPEQDQAWRHSIYCAWREGKPCTCREESPSGGPFVCAPADVDESSGLADLGQKHPDWHSVHADLWDARADR